ncbi:MAG TPA: Hpt domain-containing protein [Azospira sp.]|nr:Hpt domain-containing protein [Azospira sp.]
MSEPVIDEATFRELQETAGAEFVAELVDTFVEEAPGMLAALRQARATGDADAFRRAAHSLKSNSLTFGATALAAAARALELGGISSDAAVDGLQSAYDAAAQRLKELRDAA